MAFESFEEPKQLKILIPGHGSKVIDGQKKVILCSKDNYLNKVADIPLNVIDTHEVYIEIDLRFDLQGAYAEEDKPTCSPVGLQMRVYVPFQYSCSIPSVFYKLYD